MARILVLSCFLAVCLPAYSQDSEVERAQALFDEIFGEVFDRDEGKLLRARELWERLASDGNPGSQYFLSFLYFSGIGGVERNEELAIEMVNAAAEADYAMAQAALGLWYESGIYVNQDFDKAVDWFRTAAANGSGLARARLYDAYTNGELGLPRDAEEARKWE